MRKIVSIPVVLLWLSAFNLSAQSEYRDYYLVGLGGKDIKVNTFEKYRYVTKDWVQYTLNKDGTATVYRDGFPDIKHKAHIHIEDTVLYKRKCHVVTEIQESAWKGAHLVLSIRLPVNITEIPHEAFSGCQSITEINIPSKVKKIGWWAFSGSGITSIVIPEGVTYIGGYAFLNCSSLKHISIPVSVEKIGEYAFGDCREIKSCKVHSQVPVIIGKDVFKSLPYHDRIPELNPILYVPKGSLDAYKNAEGWSKFKDIREYDVLL
jgi:hypothetical protein